MTPEELQAIRERARNRGAGIDIPMLLDEVERLSEENATLRALLQEMTDYTALANSMVNGSLYRRARETLAKEGEA